MAYGPVQRIYANGVGSMSVPIKPNLTVRGAAFVLTFVRVHFVRVAGSGTDTATLYLDLDSVKGAQWDARLLGSSAVVGVGADVNWRYSDDTQQAFSFIDGDVPTLVWTNPDANEIEWGVEVGVQEWL